MFSLRVKNENTKETQDALDCEISGAEEIPPLEENTDTILCSSGNPRVEHLVGACHFYKHSSTERGDQKIHQLKQLPKERGIKLCVIALPRDLGVPEFCSFISPYLLAIQRMRVVRREASNPQIHMVLLKFIDQEQADQFYQDYNGRPFSSLEKSVLCRLVFLKHVEIAGMDGFDPLPPSGATEIPSCPVCLERMDESTSGIVTTVCNHQFHHECLQQWGDTSCPVCRYCNNQGTTSKCSECGVNSGLWICLICGHVGCGRYASAHAKEHWRETQHCFAMEMDSGRAWDYVGDNYVHRLIQTSVEGKMVELPHAAAGRETPEIRSVPAEQAASEQQLHDRDKMEDAMLDSKLDFLSQEYNHLLVTQLDAQREYFEGILQKNAEESAILQEQLTTVALQGEKSVSELHTHVKESQHKIKQLEKKLDMLQTTTRKLQEERDFYKEINTSLSTNQGDYEKMLEETKQKSDMQNLEKDSKIQELEEQVRDLMVYIQAQNAVNAEGSELQGASVVSVADAPQKIQKLNKKKNSKR